jgi:AAA15 family ATPase/GTPase
MSFYGETEFDMFPNIKREKFSRHIYADMAVPVLKQAAIYGANGSGKSNFIKAIVFYCCPIKLANVNDALLGS